MKSRSRVFEKTARGTRSFKRSHEAPRTANESVPCGCYYTRDYDEEQLTRVSVDEPADKFRFQNYLQHFTRSGGVGWLCKKEKRKRMSCMRRPGKGLGC